MNMPLRSGERELVRNGKRDQMKPPVSLELRQHVLALRRTHTFSEVAKSTNLPLGTVKTICSRSGAFRDNLKLRKLFALPGIM